MVFAKLVHPYNFQLHRTLSWLFRNIFSTKIEHTPWLIDLERSLFYGKLVFVSNERMFFTLSPEMNIGEQKWECLNAYWEFSHFYLTLTADRWPETKGTVCAINYLV